MKSICGANGVLVCDSIQKIHIEFCLKLKRLPLHLPFRDDGQPSPPPSHQEICLSSRMWSKLEWDYPNAKSLLQPYIDITI